MKKFSDLIKEQRYEELPYDWDMPLFEMANAMKIETGLPVNVYYDSREEKVEHGPRIKFQNDKANNVHKSNTLSMTIGTDPHIPNSQIHEKNNVSDCVWQIARWVRGNRIVLLLCWNNVLTQTQTGPLLRKYNEITDEILEAEDKIDYNTVDLQYYLSGKHLHRPPKNLEELMDIVYDTIDKEGTNCSLNHIDTSNITNMSGLFDGVDFTGDISDWDTSKVKNMTTMFKDCPFNGDISKWDVSNVRDTTCMFMNSKFNQDISNWNFKSLKSSYGMFENCPIKNTYKPKI